jgi:hypothetical protein
MNIANATVKRIFARLLQVALNPYGPTISR